ncbi:MAG TPA: LuxR C-terminal-related transcriptional regulator [Acidimicrobiales bacterium]|jgi:LuxR family maltose regulon positive regulatory protein
MIHILERQRKSSVVIVAAPAGYGKTTILAQWAARDPRPVAWLQLDEHDNDTVTLMAYVVLALRQVAELDPKIDEWLITRTPPMSDLILPTLANDLSAADPFLFVLDDTHVLTGESSWSIVQFLVEHLPPSSQIALGGRVDPPVSLGRMATNGRLVEVRSADLAFRNGEAESMLAEGGLHLEETALRMLLARTEGWAAGLQLAMLYLQNRGDPAALADLHGGVGHIPDYLAHEVLAGLPLRIKRFLLRTSVLERLSTESCNAVMGHRGSGEILAELERSNVFLTRLDERGKWYRYHSLFAEWLRTQLERDSPEAIPELHRKAAAWYRSKGMPEDAFEHWLAAGDVEQAGELVARHFRTWAMGGRTETVLRWFSAFDEEQILAYPQLALAGAWFAAALGHSQTAATRLAAAERGDPQAPSLEGAATFGSALLTLRALLGQRGVGALHGDAEAAYQLERSVGGALEATAACLAGAGRLLSERDISGARTLLEEAAALGREGEPSARVGSLGLLALIAAQCDQWDEAAKLATVAQRVVEQHKLSNLSLIACVYAMVALVESHRGDVDSAHTNLDLVGQMLAGLAPYPWIAALVATIMAWSAVEIEEIKKARALQREAALAAGKLPDAGLLVEWIDELRRRVGAETGHGPALTPSELRVLQELTTFRSVSDTARDLLVSTNTVKSHLKLVYRKLGASSRAEAIERGRRMGLLER